MPFRYVAYNRQGERVRGIVEGDSEEAAEQFLWENEFTIVKLKKAGKPFVLHEQLPSLFGVRGRDVIDFANQLAFLIRAGISAYTALQIIRDQTAKPALREVLSSIVEDISQGSTLSEACSRNPTVFPVVFVRMLRVGEETGRADIALQTVASYLERQRAAMEKVRASLTYPVLVMGMAAISMYILIVVALPNLLGLFQEFGAQMPLPTRILLAVVSFAGTWGKPLGLAIATVVVAAILYTRTPNGRRHLHYFMVRLPTFGSLVVKMNLARITDTTASLLSSGIPVLETLDLLVQTTPNMAIREPLQEIRADVETGSSLSQAVGRHPIFPPMMISLLRVGEEAGTLEETLTTLGHLYNQEAERSISSLIGLLEPALTIVIGVAIGFISITIITTVYSVLPQIK